MRIEVATSSQLPESKQDDGSPSIPQDGIKTVSFHYLSGKNLISLKDEFKRQLFLLFVSVSGGSIYFFLAKDFADQKGDYIDTGSNLSNQLICGFSVALTALAVLYNSTDIFFAQRHNEAVPRELEKELTPFVKGWKSKLNIYTIVGGSAASAVPLTMVSIFYPAPIPLPVTIIQAILVEFDNTILHFLPLKLALTYPIYRLPVLPLEFIIKRCIGSSPVLKNETAEIIRARLLSFLNRAQQHLVLNPRFNWSTFTYEWQFSQNFHQLMQNPQSNSELLVAVASEFPGISVFNQKSVSTWRSKLSELCGFVGAGWVTGGLAGYLILPIMEMFSELDSGVGTFFSTAAPVYFLAVLFSFFGYGIGKTLYQNITAWESTDSKLPFEFKFSPKTFSAIMLFNLWLNLYSYAAAEELDHELIPEDAKWAHLKLLVIWLARTGVPLLGFYAIKDLMQTLIRKWCTHRETGDTQLAARLMTFLEQLTVATHMMNEGILLSSKDSLVRNHIISDFAMSEKKSVVEEEKGQKQISWKQWAMEKLCFWRPKAENEQPLLDSIVGSDSALEITS